MNVLINEHVISHLTRAVFSPAHKRDVIQIKRKKRFKRETESVIEMCLFLPSRDQRVRVTYARESLHPPRPYCVCENVSLLENTALKYCLTHVQHSDICQRQADHVMRHSRSSEVVNIHSEMSISCKCAHPRII